MNNIITKSSVMSSAGNSVRLTKPVCFVSSVSPCLNSICYYECKHSYKDSRVKERVTIDTFKAAVLYLTIARI